ncbi:alpha/beta fold hydrolase BchO [Falsiroseomonas sp.]|uniref:alpha/beta fold hydrolase BchO n=1 Tax=Falsiroseomonas sp. TaxID=2870721 RepID=UPI0027286D0F|nr:alpha/beta fold hydrolase BchO [Falsiroseomonas sp.]MDO9503365.1 alpha/beta fold hydrolase [Falsiroseomonas sp.]MDP3416226.1 alpha/beta fold hydrolase [Falsiroseomonas sp.]
MAERPNWNIEGRDWPNRAASRFVTAAGLRWHVQVMGQGPVLLLLHGTAAATHSWRDLMPLLARDFTVVAPDLPGHGFSDGVPAVRLSLPHMAASVAALLGVLGMRPVLAAGHSAGAAILLRMALDGRIAPDCILSLNGALQPLGDRHAAFFTRTARMLVGLPFVPSLFAWRAADRAVAERLLRDTGSRIEARGVDLYARLFRHSGHLAAALGMMAHWDLVPLLRDLPRLAPRLVLVVGAEDRAVPPVQAEAVRKRLPTARIVTLPGLGHLAHEEQPAQVATLIQQECAGALAA